MATETIPLVDSLENGWVLLSEAAEMLDRSSSWLRKRLKSGEIPGELAYDPSIGRERWIVDVSTMSSGDSLSLQTHPGPGAAKDFETPEVTVQEPVEDSDQAMKVDTKAATPLESEAQVAQLETVDQTIHLEVAENLQVVEPLEEKLDSDDEGAPIEEETIEEQPDIEVIELPSAEPEETPAPEPGVPAGGSALLIPIEAVDRLEEAWARTRDAVARAEIAERVATLEQERRVQAEEERDRLRRTLKAEHEMAGRVAELEKQRRLEAEQERDRLRAALEAQPDLTSRKDRRRTGR